MSWRRRSLWIATAAVLYVGVAALRARPDAPQAWAGLVLGPLLVVLGWRLVATPVRTVDRIDPLARSAARVVVTGAVCVAVAHLAPRTPSFLAIRHLGVGVACMASLVALVRVSSLGGIAARPARGRQLDAAAFASLLWTVAVGLAAAQAIAPNRTALLDPSAVDYASVAASLGSIGIALVSSLRLYALRRFELGVAERAAAALWLTVLCLAIGVFATLMSVARPEVVVPLAALFGALCITATAISQQPALVSRLLRTAASLTMLCAPLVCVAVVVAYKVPTMAGLILFVVTIAAACLGLLAPRLASQLAPERGRWIKALDGALRAAREPEPQQAVVDVLSSIRDGLGRQTSRAAIYRLASADRLVVDRAGYLHTEAAEFPERLVELAEREPERVLSTEALRYVQIPRPEVRSLVQWLDVRDAGAIALVLDQEICVGALLWPAAGRSSPLSYEEVCALRRLADHLGAAIGAAAQLARSRAGELRAQKAVELAQRRVGELREIIVREGSRQEAIAEEVARTAQVACYSPAAQTALMDVETAGAAGLPVGLVVAPGVDGSSWAAVVHLASPRRAGMLLEIDGAVAPWSAPAAEAQQVLDRWANPAGSPLTMARGGTLVLRDPQLLPPEVQRYLATALGDDTGLVVLIPRSLDELAAQGAVEPHLASRLGQRVVALPTLAERAEDLRALALYKLARLGMRLRGEPFGLSLAAQQRVNEHEWPGNEQELDAVLLRAALATAGPAVGRAAIERLLSPPLVEPGASRSG